MHKENSPATQSHRIIYLFLLIAVGLFVIALSILVYFWDLLVGIYQTVFLVFGFLPTLVALFAVLYLWSKQNREEALRRFMQEEEAKKKAEKSSAP